MSSRHSISSGANRLGAIFVHPMDNRARAAVLICHGIAETVETWRPVQQLLAVNGVSSLVFDYSGFGMSTGKPDWTQFEQDALAAFHRLEDLDPALPKSIIGFSMGSGVAAAIANDVRASRLVLCSGFPSFRAAAHAAGVPKMLSRYVPPIWQAEESLAGCRLPVLVVHGENDGLFPVALAHQLAGCCEPRATVVLIPNTTHNQPFRRPSIYYWGPIIDWIVQ